MTVLANQATESKNIVSLWQQRRNTIGAVWRDVQWRKFDAVCNEEIKKLLKQNLDSTEQLDSELTRAMQLLKGGRY